MAGVFGVAKAPLLSISHRIAFEVPFDEITGVAPCGPSVSGDWDEAGAKDEIPPDIGNDISLPLAGAT
jgi:hypothetical protein